jgi:hypothetical protein
MSENIQRSALEQISQILGDLDLLGYVEPLGDFDAISANAEIMEVGGLSLRIISLADLIRIKEYIRRPKDQDSLFQLRAIQKIRSERNE